MDLKDALEFLSEQAVRARQPEILKPPAEPDHIYLMQDSEGEWLRNEADPKPRNHIARDLSAIIDFAGRATEGEPSAVWYSREKVVCVLDDSTRRDTVTLPLPYSPQLKALMGVERTAFDQKGIILFLRVTLKACLGQCPDLIETLRRVKFDNGMVIDSAVNHGRSSIGKEIRSEITGAKVIPEYVRLDVPIFESGFPQLRFPVEVAIDPDPSTAQFKLLPIPGEIERAIAAAEASIGEQLQNALSEAHADVLYGVP